MHVAGTVLQRKGITTEESKHSNSTPFQEHPPVCTCTHTNADTWQRAMLHYSVVEVTKSYVFNEGTGSTDRKGKYMTGSGGPGMCKLDTLPHQLVHSLSLGMITSGHDLPNSRVVLAHLQM